MIGRLVHYSYGGVRSRALATRLLTPGQIADLVGSGSREKAAAALEHRLPPADERAEIEQRLQSEYLQFGRLILRTLPDPGGRLLRSYLERNWVENLQTLCRTVLRATPAGRFPQPLPVLDPVPLPEPGEVENLPDLAVRLPAGPYREVLRDHLKNADLEGPEPLENGLIRVYWDRVADRVRRLPPFDRAAAGEILALRADIDALRILRRGRKAGLEAERILAAWPPPARLLDPERVRGVMRSADSEEGLRRLLQRTIGSDLESDEALESALRRRLYRELRRSLLSAPFDIAVPLSVLLLKELEVTDLRGVLGGLRFGLEPDRIIPFVVGLEG